MVVAVFYSCMERKIAVVIGIIIAIGIGIGIVIVTIVIVRIFAALVHTIAIGSRMILFLVCVVALADFRQTPVEIINVAIQEH